ncbi:hypothetical protein PV419_51125 [Streptomyces sp. ME19-01-6]|nr:hypothetical protein [Streptomyces sp. ME19-01-6]MDX3233735.1 hypothetical protein [Streptomyces sp. ME19-01-6]
MEIQRRTGGARTRRGAAAVAGGLLAGLMATTTMATVTGCSSQTVADERPGGESRAAAVAALHRAADVLVRSGSSRVRTTMETATGGTRVSIRGSGAYDFVRRMGRLRLVLPRDAMGAAEHEPITELLASGALFMRNRGAGIPPDKWVRVDTAGIPDGNLVTGGATDPLAAAELLRGARGVSLVGEEGLGGTVVRHYRGTTDIGRAARVASPGVRGPLAAAARGFTEHAVPFDAYLDRQGRLREVRHHFTVTSEASGQDGQSGRGSQSGRGGQPRQGDGTGTGTGGGTASGGGGGAGRPGQGGRAARGGPGHPSTPGPQGVRRTLGVASTIELYDFGAPAVVRLPKTSDIYTGRVGSPQT